MAAQAAAAPTGGPAAGELLGNVVPAVAAGEDNGMAGERRESKPSKTESRGMAPFPLYLSRA